MKKYFSLLLLLLLGFVFLGCDDVISTEEVTDEIITQEDLAVLSDQLEGFSDYEELRSYFSEIQSSSRDGYLYAEGAVDAPTMTNDEQMEGDDQAKDHSETNVQVEGVGEMDSIITDGSYIYMARNHILQIVDLDTMAVIYIRQLEEGYYQGIFLYEDTLVAIYSQYQRPENFSDDYYYAWRWGSTSLMVDVIDISDKDDINVSRSLEYQNAYLTDVRMIEDQVYLMMTSYQWNYYMFDYMLEGGVEEDANETTTQEAVVDVFVPKYKDSLISDEYIPLSWENIYYFPDNDLTNSYLLVASFSVIDQEPMDINAYLGNGFEVYMNHNNLYVAGSQYDYDEEEASYTQYTNILRFEILNKKLYYRASNQIEGWTLNQYSFDEYDGVLRVATTIYNWDRKTWESQITNQLYLLDASDANLSLISKLEGLGKPNERIYAVRMSGDIGYVVTFVNTDPLYKIDLSDPQNPTILGELYEEGVSDYLHPYSDDLMIGIGRQAITQDGWTNFIGVKVALYDVSEDDPIALDTLLVEGEYSYSPVSYNQKLFVEYNWNETYLFAIPVYGYNNNYDAYYQAIYVYEVNDSTLTEKAILIEDNNSSYWGNIEKAIFIGDSIYTISYSQITEYDMDNDFEVVETLVLHSYEDVEIKPTTDEEPSDAPTTEYDEPSNGEDDE